MSDMRCSKCDALNPLVFSGLCEKCWGNAPVEVAPGYCIKHKAYGPCSCECLAPAAPATPAPPWGDLFVELHSVYMAQSKPQSFEQFIVDQLRAERESRKQAEDKAFNALREIRARIADNRRIVTPGLVGRIDRALATPLGTPGRKP